GSVANIIVVEASQGGRPHQLLGISSARASHDGAHPGLWLRVAVGGRAERRGWRLPDDQVYAEPGPGAREVLRPTVRLSMQFPESTRRGVAGPPIFSDSSA